MRLTHQVAEVTLSLDSGNAYADGDVLSATQEVSDVLLSDSGRATLDSLLLLDKDDQGGDLDIVLLSANKSIGSENSAVSITDGDAGSVVAIISVSSSDYADLVGCQIADKGSLGRVIEGSSTSLYLGTVSRATKTYAANGLVIKLGFKDIS